MDKADKSRLQTSYRARGKSVMFTAHCEDGRTAYFVVKGHGGPDQDFLATGMAQERQRTGEVPEGVIRTVRRVR
jgi:hypothetical protein